MVSREKLAASNTNMSYEKSPLNISPAVEVAYDLHPAAALYRAATFNELDSALQRRSAEFRKRLYTDSQPDSWRDKITLLSVFADRSIAAPRNKAQLNRSEKSKKSKGDPDWNLRHLAVTPLLASCTNFVRNDDNLWDYPRRMALSVRRGCLNRLEYQEVMAIISSGQKDIFQKFVDAKLQAFDVPAVPGVPRDVEQTIAAEDADLSKLLYPYSGVLVSNLRLMCGEWRQNLVSTQFIVLLDSVLRLHAFSEVRHLATANASIFDALLKSQATGRSLSREDIVQLLAPHPLHEGLDLLAEVRSLAVHLERAKQGWRILGEAGCDIASQTHSVDALVSWSEAIASNSDQAFTSGIEIFRQQSLDGELDRNIDKSSSMNNFDEFMKYALQQRPMNTGRDGQYDQGYWARKQGAHNSAPYKISISPFGGLAFAGLAANSMPTCTFADVKQSLMSAGLALGESGQDQLYRSLKGLGTTVDSPDGAGGFLVSNPFYISR